MFSNQYALPPAYQSWIGKFYGQQGLSDECGMSPGATEGLQLYFYHYEVNLHQEDHEGLQNCYRTPQTFKYEVASTRLEPVSLESPVSK